MLARFLTHFVRSEAGGFEPPKGFLPNWFFPHKTEGGGFEPPRGFLLYRISSAAHSSTLPTFRFKRDCCLFFKFYLRQLADQNFRQTGNNTSAMFCPLGKFASSSNSWAFLYALKNINHKHIELNHPSPLARPRLWRWSATLSLILQILPNFSVFAKKNRILPNAAYENLLRTKIAFARANSRAQNACRLIVSSSTRYRPSCRSRSCDKTSWE